MQSWQLPEYISDILPSSARILESAKEKLLSLFHLHGYQLVMPPMMEYTHSLLTRIDAGLSLKTIRVTDQFSGLQLGLRADITPQISRIDAHILSANNGINRFCYAGSVLHTQPDTLYSTREPLQIGAELYGFDGILADIELVDLMLKSMEILGVENPLLSLGHISVFRSLAETTNLSNDDTEELLTLMQSKNTQDVYTWCKNTGLEDKLSQAFSSLTTLYGEPEKVLQQAMKSLPQTPAIQSALNDLKKMCETFNQYQIHLDLSELRADRYHSGLLFATYRSGESDALVRGGRYDGLGQYFGRSRPATGFSFDLKNFLELLPQPELSGGICVKSCDAVLARDEIENLRQNGEVVIIDYLDEGAKSLGCNRLLLQQENCWKIIDIQ